MDTNTTDARGAALTQVDTGNMGGDIWRDAEGYAYWSDGQPITATEALADDDLSDVLAMCGLMARDTWAVTL